MRTKRKVAMAVGFLSLAMTHGLAQETSPRDASAAPRMPDDVATSVIQDPAMHGMDAIDVNYPRGWHFAGVMDLDGTGGFMGFRECGPGQIAVYRVTSPDGLSFVEQMPTFTWKWETGPKARSHANDFCLHLDGATNAKKFLSTLAQVLGVEFVADAPVPANVQARQDALVRFSNANAQQAYAKDPTRAPELTAETARAEIRYLNGTYAMRGQLTAQIGCWSTATVQFSTKPSTAKDQPETPTRLHTCTAFVNLLAAPENEFAGLAAKWDVPLPDAEANMVQAAGKGTDNSDPQPLGVAGMGTRPRASWLVARQAKQVDELEHQGANSFIRNEEELSWRGPLQLSMAVRDQMVKDWEARERHGARQATEPGAVALTGLMSPDWVDEMLGSYEQDANNDGDIRLKPAAEIGWSDQEGKNRFRTHDAEANPNGILPGVWTKSAGPRRSPTPQ